ncbi:MAG: THUMP domain-containing protein [Cyanobacteria bacterium]|nr:THUMP domain-containing protein [Cyanobacteriota bacterium]
MQQLATSLEDFDLAAVVPPGLEQVAAAELAALGAEEVRPLRRAVACRTDLAGFYRLHLRARIPFRFLRELARFPCRGRADLHYGVQHAADWDHWLPPEASFKVEASGSLPELNHSHYTALEVKNALVDLQRQRWGSRSMVNLEDPDLALHLHLSPGRPFGGRGEGPIHPGNPYSGGRDSSGRGGGGRGPGGRGPGGRGPTRNDADLGGGMAILSLEGDGSSLHRRGYRAAMGLAPLKENLAAGLIALTGWDGSVPLVDPLGGSGTLLLEAAAAALGHAPGLRPPSELGSAATGHGRAFGRPAAAGNGPMGDIPAFGPTASSRPAAARSFSFERWPDFDPGLWRREVEAAAAQTRPARADGSAVAPLVGIEQDPAVLAQARANAAAAGLAEHLRLEPGDFRDFSPPPGPGILVCNPPYGDRLGRGDDLEALYADLGRMVRERCSGWTLWLLSGNPALTGALRLKASQRIAVSNGGIDCRWLRYEIR